MEFLDEAIEAYVERYTSEESKVLKELNRETYSRVLIPRMLAGHLQGRVISMFSHMINPRQVLEIGTYTGYSALCWAEGLQDEGQVHTIDVNEELEEMAARYINKAGQTSSVVTYLGNAVDIIPSIDQTFDVVYIDADKENYSKYYDLVIDKVRTGGYIIADNVLWSGKVVEVEESQDEDTQALVSYCEKIQSDSRVINVLFPVRDGLLVARKL
ncbi:MAG TPA: methyltransferase domain-containing protein [Flavobacteriales bacterium]|nr:methyltransferase domain-containing protein [Flavobacteriales bacterium]